MKKLFLVAVMAVVVALALAACASSGSEEPAGEPESAVEEQQTGMPNPWSDVASADEAAQGAGVGSFEVADNLGVADMKLFDPVYRCMDGIAEMQAQGGAFDVTVRKSATLSGLDLNGDYGEYPLEWTQDCDGIQVSCRGYEEGMAAAFDWAADDANYSVMFRGLGGENMAVSADEVATIIENVR